MLTIENILIGIIGRPVLVVIKWLRWYFFIGGLIFNTIEVFDPATKKIILSHFTILPFVFGLILFCIGLTIKRYDECYKDYSKLMNEKF